MRRTLLLAWLLPLPTLLAGEGLAAGAPPLLRARRRPADRRDQSAATTVALRVF
ncbi:MAG: hypothetical protein VKQ33_08660 [Candidatus Sericytochromatia bacterium]|nr:hypothetical protein [Candidatus Sericytochromatia bacterium]